MRIQREGALHTRLPDWESATPAHAESLASLVGHTMSCEHNTAQSGGGDRVCSSLTEAIDALPATSFCRSETTIRREMGADIDATCGQLRRRWGRGEGERASDKRRERGRSDMVRVALAALRLACVVVLPSSFTASAGCSFSMLQ